MCNLIKYKIFYQKFQTFFQAEEGEGREREKGWWGVSSLKEGHPFMQFVCNLDVSKLKKK